MTKEDMGPAPDRSRTPDRSCLPDRPHRLDSARPTNKPFSAGIMGSRYKSLLRELVTAAVRRRALAHMEARLPGSIDLSRVLDGDITVGDVLKGTAELDVVLLVRLEEEFEVGLWPDREELEQLVRVARLSLDADSASDVNARPQLGVGVVSPVAAGETVPNTTLEEPKPGAATGQDEKR